MGEVETSCDGLTKDEAAKRLSENGKNELEQGKRKALSSNISSSLKIP